MYELLLRVRFLSQLIISIILTYRAINDTFYEEIVNYVLGGFALYFAYATADTFDKLNKLGKYNHEKEEERKKQRETIDD